MDSLDNMKHMLKLMENAGELHHGDPADFTDSDLAQLISDTVTAGELDLDFDNLSSVADELNATVHWDRMDFADDIADAEFTAGQIEAVLPQVSDLLADQLADIDADAAPGDHDRITAALEQIQQYPGVTEDMLIPREYQFAEDELEEADLNNGYGQHHSVDGEDLFPNGADGPIQRKVPGRSDNRLGRDKAVPVESLGEGRDFAAFRPLEDTEEVVKKFTHRDVPVIITKNSDTVKVGSMPYELYINFDHHDHYESVEQATHEAKLEIEDQEMFAADRTDPDQMGLFTESTKSSAPTESLEESFQRLQKIYDNYTKRSARK